MIDIKIIVVIELTSHLYMCKQITVEQFLLTPIHA